NAWLALGGEAVGVRAGQAYVDVGTLHGYREAIAVLAAQPPDEGRLFDVHPGGRDRHPRLAGRVRPNP
ncbi:MAG TPA: hypothetical protein VF170_06790, partial [Planctomycetaceae bacterium]